MDPLLPPSPFPSFPTATIPPTTSPFPNPSEVNHVAPPSNPAPAVTQTFNHPPYAEMIFAAITALNEREGSSKRAIAKYIEKAYTGLPTTHPALLTHHLKRLKNSGLLVMVKKSYMVPPRSDNVTATTAATATTTTNGGYAGSGGVQLSYSQQQFQPTLPPHEQGYFPHVYQPQPQQIHAFTQAPGFPGPGVGPVPSPSPVTDPSAASSGIKRGRGRPPKPKNVVHSAPGFNFQVQQQPHLAVAAAELNGAAQPVLVALGLADDPSNVVKRRPGRPKKDVVGDLAAALVPVAASLLVKRGRGRPPRSGSGKLGRPRKPKSLSAGVKRGPGRPPKSQVQSQLTLVNVPFAIDPALLNVPRPRGRPKKVAVPGVGGVVPMKRPGRLPKSAGGVNRPRKSTGRPVGRPRKNALLATEAHNYQLQVEAFEDLKRKLEFIQSRIMQAVSVLKPEFTNESAVNTIAAIQELEGLASMDITTPFREDPQPPVLQM